MFLRVERQASPVGVLLIVTDDTGRLHGLEFADHEARMRQLLHRYAGAVELREAAAPAAVTLALAAYFAGDLDGIDGLPVAATGSAFQRRVWAALRAIPAGTTISYGRLAATIGQPGASRAVGLANGANPVGIVVPCHRVIGADGTLTGYGGGLARKRWLIDHERRYAPAAGLESVGGLFASGRPCEAADGKVAT